MVQSCFSPGGRVFFIDNHSDPQIPEKDFKDPYILQYELERHVRRLNDGREYNVVKVMYERDELAVH